MTRLFYVLTALWLAGLNLFAQGPSRIAVMAFTNGNLLTPTNFFISNLVAGANVSLSVGAGGKVTLSVSATNVTSTNFDGVIVTNVIRGTNYDFYTATNVPQGILTWEWWTNLSSTIAGASGTNFPSIYVTNYIRGTNGSYYTATNVPDGILTWKWWTNLASTISGTASNAIANLNGQGTNTTIRSTNDSVPLRIYGAASQSADFLEVLTSGSNLLFYITETGALTGNGEGLTNLNATQLKSGTVPLARLSGITSNQIADATMTSNQIASGTITTNKMSKEAHEAYVGGAGSGVVTNAHLTNLVNVEYKSYTNSAFVTNVWYVAPWGSDSNPGTPLQPLATLSNAVYLTDARSNSTIFVQAGEYLIPGQYNAITNLGDTTVAGSIRMHYKGNVRIVPLGLVNFYAPTGYSVISMKGCSNIYIGPGLKIRTGKTAADVNALSNSVNGNPNRWFGSIHINHSEGIEIDGVTIEDALCYGIFQNNESGPYTSTNVAIRNCNTIHCGTSMGDPTSDESVRWYLENTNYFGGGYSIGGGNSLDNCSSFEDQVGVYLRNVSSVGRHRAVSITRAKIINPNFRGIFSGPYQNFDGLLLKDSYLRRITNGMHAAGGAGTLTLPFMFPVRGAELCEVGMNNFTASDTTFDGGWQAIQQVGGYVTNWLVTGCTFNDCWCYTVQPVNYNSVGFGSRISRCTFNNCGQYAVIYSGSIFECAVEDNMINGYGLVEASQAAIGFKLAPAISNVAVLRNTIIGPVAMNGLHAIDFGTTNSHIGHVIAGANWVSRTEEAIRIASYYGILSRDLPMIFETNAARTLGVIMVDPFTNSIARTNFYAETNWVNTFVNSKVSGGSVTNWSAGITNDTHLAVVSGGTNATGAIKTVKAGSNVTITEEGSSNLVFAASLAGGAASMADVTNVVQSYVGSNATNVPVAQLNYFTNRDSANVTALAWATNRDSAHVTALTYLTNNTAAVGTNFYNVQVSNSVRSLNGYFTNLTVDSTFTNRGTGVFSNQVDFYGPVYGGYFNVSTNISGTLNVTGNADVSGNLSVSGTNTVSTLEVTNLVVGTITNVSGVYGTNLFVGGSGGWTNVLSFLAAAGDPGGTNARQYGTASLSNLSAITFSTGDVIYKHANGLTNLGIGTAGQYLASMGGVPTWSNGPVGGGSADMPEMWIRTNLYASNAFLLSLTVTNTMTISTVNVQRLTATNMDVENATFQTLNVNALNVTNGITSTNMVYGSDRLYNGSQVTGVVMAAFSSPLQSGNAGETLVVHPVYQTNYWHDHAKLLWVDEPFCGTVSASATIHGFGGSALWGVGGFAPTVRGGRRGFGTLTDITCTNLGYGAMRFSSSATPLAFETNIFFETDTYFQGSLTNGMIRLGGGTSAGTSQQTSTNDTAYVFWEFDPINTTTTNWVVRCAGSVGTNLFTNTAPISLTTWFRLGIYGNSNTMWFTTNGVICASNVSSAMLPGGSSLYWGGRAASFSNAPVGTTITTERFALDYIRLIEYP